MKTQLTLTIVLLLYCVGANAQMIPIDTSNWDIQARSYVIESYKGKDAIYLQAGSITLKDTEFLNGTIEFDLFLKAEQCFPGVYFRGQFETGDAEQFFVRPHLSGKPDANQAAPLVKNITPWQLFFGEKYSFPYEYKFDDWTHVKLLINDNKAQVFLDYSKSPNHSWELYHKPKKGVIALRGGNRSGIHIADIKVSHEAPSLVDFSPKEREPLKDIISEWTISDMFEEKLLEDPNETQELISSRKWQGKIQVEEGTAVNISRIQNLRDGSAGNTVFAKVTITSDKDQIKLFEFGYSDRVVAILNGNPIYWGNNKWRSRDYRYLGTVGLFDGIYLNLKKGKNELLMAVSEDFGGWLITGRIKNTDGISIK
ncbi:hypothetical protein [Ekhidna sp. To15]|uniref:hypothetical protein n=1 Tax=Ekhidna sp. To15 TaxID=3395267 RepID=UPI003F5217D2